MPAVIPVQAVEVDIRGGGGSGGGASYSSSAAYSGLGDVVVRSETGGKGHRHDFFRCWRSWRRVLRQKPTCLQKLKAVLERIKLGKANGFEDIYNELCAVAGRCHKPQWSIY